MRIKINMLEATAAGARSVKELTAALKEATATLKLAEKIGDLTRTANNNGISQNMRNRIKAQIAAVKEKAGVTRTPNYAAALNTVNKLKSQLEKQRAKARAAGKK